MALAPLRLALLPVKAFIPLSNSADGSSPSVVCVVAHTALKKRNVPTTTKRRVFTGQYLRANTGQCELKRQFTIRCWPIVIETMILRSVIASPSLL
jgi:hypothetical protein